VDAIEQSKSRAHTKKEDAGKNGLDLARPILVHGSSFLLLISIARDP
jgi:hypothetical protein